MDEPVPEDHWSALLPESMFRKAEPLGASYPVSSVGGLDTVNRIEFSGGGGVLEFSMEHHNLEEHVSKIGSPNENSKGESDIEIASGTDTVLSSVMFAFALSGTVHYEDERSNTETKTSESTTSISFTLGDQEKDDTFAVDVFTDPVYGTFIFKTISGQSMCPHEENTVEGAVPEIQVYTRPGGPVLPDGPMVFQLKLSNRGVVEFGFELFTYDEDNIGLLSLDGGSHTFDTITSKEPLYSTLSLYRGPIRYEYPSIKLGFRLACDNGATDQVRQTLIFH